VKVADLNRWEKYFEARNSGVAVEAAARKARLSASTAYRFERGDPGSGGLEAAARLGVSLVAGNLVAQPLSEEAKKSLDDFAFFRRRYFGRNSTPWQERAAYEILRILEDPSRDRKFVVMNEPPGSGKSTLFSHDIPVWLIVRNRTIRIQIGSRTERQARMYVSRIKRSLEREVPLRANADSLALGLAFDADACIQDDFGAFKPEGRSDMWRAEGLVVRQLDGVSLDDKEQTVSAWGQDSGFLGGRYDFVIWDDLVDRKNSKTEESREGLKEWWDSEAESRVEPGGLMLLQGQRIQHNDLYRHCLDKKRIDETPKYTHITYKSHYEDLCTGEHEGLQPWPKSCLLDPNRLPFEHLQTIKHNNPRAFSVMYQQEDGDIAGGLVDSAWIVGGLDAEGYPAPGCLDKERSLLEVPAHLMNGQGWSFVTVDPSPTEWWGVIWWVYDPESGNRYIVDLHKKRLNPEQFLSLDLDTFEWSGLVVDIWNNANNMQAPISHIIVEVNAAQRWLLNQPHVQRWSAMTGVSFVPHTTSINKQDPRYGLESIGDLFRQGRIRMPWGNIAARSRLTYLIDEATKYPEHDTTDLIMSTWFGKLAVENLYTPRKSGMYRLDRPSWMGYKARGIA
jgi:hypothetical protein